MKKLELSALHFSDSFAHQKSVLFTSEDFGANTKVQVLRVKPNQYIPPHHHNVRTEMFRIIEGNGEIIVNDIVVTSPNDIMLCQPGDIHAMRNKSSSDNFDILIVRTNDPGNEDMIWEVENE